MPRRWGEARFAVLLCYDPTLGSYWQIYDRLEQSRFEAGTFERAMLLVDALAQT